MAYVCKLPHALATLALPLFVPADRPERTAKAFAAGTDAGLSMGEGANKARRVDLDALARDDVASWRAGETLLLSGRMPTGRDAAHKRLADLIARSPWRTRTVAPSPEPTCTAGRASCSSATRRAPTYAPPRCDPERDTLPRLRDDLSSTPAQTAALTRAYHVHVRRVDTPDDGYTIDHTSTVYLMDAGGRLAGESEDRMLAKLTTLARPRGTPSDTGAREDLQADAARLARQLCDF